ncbi:tripartite tricarboxylate transporter TctB family protein [Noviherbaspirillum aerium]|uniref:tripartite tricarboxylate transporter TctB family protein n=1 Tax=Noviherbaspirillum aerium TaxID=2588497 RepID=UPI00178C1FC5|nr:tripartite tricarboxylate transporter TctB family protein [Noviherbaspirillum aerium]
MKFNDAVFGAVFLVLAIAVLITARSFPAIPGQQIGPGAFPTVVASIMAVCALLLIVRGVRGAGSRQRWFEAGDWLSSPRHVLRFAAVVAALLFYLAAAQTLGFVITGILLMTGLLRAFGVRWIVTLGTAVAATLLIHSIFYKMLKVPLPWGLLQGVAW